MLFISCKSVPASVQKPAAVKTEEQPAPEMPADSKQNTVTEQPAAAKKPEQAVPAVQPAAPTPETKDGMDEVIAEFDGVTITKKDKEIAKAEITEVVNKLNDITERKDYAQWVTFLSENYKEEFSNPAVLKKTSENLPGAARGIKLKGLSDYFHYVFIPSRQQGRVDDIRYLSPIRVRVLKKEKHKELIFYDLEKINGRWKLVPRNMP